MPPKRSTKAKAGMSQAPLAFQTRKPGGTKSKPKATAGPSTSRSPSLKASASESSIIRDDDDRDDSEMAIPLQAVDSQPTVQDRPGSKRQLDVKSKEWAGVIKNAHREMGGMQPIHAGPDTHNEIHHVLRIFDMTSAYGPFIGVTRLQRWERAKKLGLNPPEEIKRILTTQQGEEDVTYRENVLHSWLG
ncbi:DNA polymerase delta, subunit 4-domain-containing protein [Kockovaella imperatae]|uniref:DNA polymerase delta, subunit 4-domain-containing protein n=1 Tax=Kockovaella imperatae TaxID=4999 RepID=A0A1Y1UH19_9TREE|nr:DNA polymerase delta, subunit 4-domain-containing protein [Kockovaella imperatae]ORX36385.1 DNA polymerase delta, subunit 4-domain-containing protein [Kockovaella imperatae]